MADYRVYFLDESGSIRRRLDLDCANDREACAAGERALFTASAEFRGIEVWQRGRFVARIERRQPWSGRVRLSA